MDFALLHPLANPQEYALVLLISLVAGTVGGVIIAKKLVVELGAWRFKLLMDALRLAAGLTMLWAALR